MFSSCNQTNKITPDDSDILLNNWMVYLHDSTRICKLSIPGTHDALTGCGFTNSEYINDYTTQVANFDQQLIGGLRYFDIRLILAGDTANRYLVTSHRTASITLSFDDVLMKAKQFLCDNPSEFLILKIQYDGGTMSDDDHTAWNSLIQSKINGDSYKQLFVDFRPDIRVKDMRGKILLISRTSYGTPVCGALTNWMDEGTDDYVKMDSIAERTLVLSPTPEAAVAYNGGDHPYAARLYVQDFYNSIGSRMTSKLNALDAMFRSAIEIPSSQNIWVLNHTSGFSTPKMNAIGYAENASKTNSRLLYLLEHDTTHAPIGIIAMDFACIDTLNQNIGTLGNINRQVMSKSLTYAIIKRNFK